MMTINNFPQLEWLKRLHAAPKRLLGAAAAAAWKALPHVKPDQPLATVDNFMLRCTAQSMSGSSLCNM
jgi:hypothetical protein